MTAKTDQIILPALRGVMGTWVFYSCLMNLRELAQRVHFAEEVHKSKQLSDMIQRQLTAGRSAQIAQYLEKQDERFFNSLVIATYGGRPNWHALSDVKSRNTEKDLAGLTDDTVASVGFLTLHGNERLFALDGQHRLAGIKKAIKDGIDQDPYDELSVIFVAHDATAKGMQRTRRLFTTLNKTARPVSKGDIIALDEDDVMAITVRWLIEETGYFRGSKLAFVASNNMPVANTESLTTIGSLYDVLSILFSHGDTGLRKPKGELQRVRPPNGELDKYFMLAAQYFSFLDQHATELHEFFRATITGPIVNKYRGNHGGSVLFRPIGLEIFTRIISRLTTDMSLSAAVQLACKLPRDLTGQPYAGIMWDKSTRTISNAHKVTVRELLLYMVNASRMTDATLLGRYRRELDNDAAKLPPQLK